MAEEAKGKRAIEMMLELHQQAIDGKMGPEIQLIAEQGVIATNELISKLLDQFAKETRNAESLRLSLEHKKTRLEMAALSVQMAEVALQAAEALEAAKEAP